MRLGWLEAWNLRCWERLRIETDTGLNLLTGANGTGKSSVLEAIGLLGRGRSFRGGAREALLREGSDVLGLRAESVFGGQTHVLAMSREGLRWRMRRDGEEVRQLAELARLCPVLVFEAGFHSAAVGAPDLRRELWQWLLFHVEPGFLDGWREARRVLQQRNAALRAEAGDRELDAWDRQWIELAGALLATAGTWVARFAETLAQSLRELLPEFGEPRVSFDPGHDGTLEVALGRARARDRALGYSTVGPHRWDWQLSLGGLERREHWSRGQQKCGALAMLLAAARCHGLAKGEWPLMLVDDLTAELDGAHQQLLLRELRNAGAQVFASSVEVGSILEYWDGPAAWFHVEPKASLRRLL